MQEFTSAWRVGSKARGEQSFKQAKQSVIVVQHSKSRVADEPSWSVQVASFLTSDFSFQLEPIPLPPRYAPQHLLHFSIETREAHCRFIRSVAVGAAAVDHEGDAGGKCGEVALDDSAVGQVDGSGDVAGGISFRAADIQDDVIGLAGFQVLVDIPAVGFEFEQFFEVLEGGHGITFARLGGRVERQKCQYALKSCHGAPRSAQACRHGV